MKLYSSRHTFLLNRCSKLNVYFSVDSMYDNMFNRIIIREYKQLNKVNKMQVNVTRICLHNNDINCCTICKNFNNFINCHVTETLSAETIKQQL